MSERRAEVAERQAPSGDHGALDILLVEDERDLLSMLDEVLRERGHRVTAVADGEQAMLWLGRRAFDLAITDVRLPRVGGMEIFRRIREESPHTRVVLMSAHGSVTEAVEAMQEHAIYYLAKPFELEKLFELVARVQSERMREQEVLEARLAGAGEQILIGESPPMVRLRRMIQAIAPSDAAVLITGESGTGKELVAQQVHQLSNRSHKPLVEVNCAAFPETLLEAELFGHERGAFTGAATRREGRFAAANGGTLFLDEVAEMSLAAQAKLLRVLETGAYQRLGSNETRRADVRIVAATNADIRARVAAGTFREDIYHRLKVFHIHVPPLRERRSDLPILIDHFRRKLSADPDAALDISPRAWAALEHYPFPGNVRELKHVIEHAIVLSGGGPVDLEHLPAEVRGDNTMVDLDEAPREPMRTLADATQEFEREYLLRALESCSWRRAATAARLGISRKTLWQKMRDHGLGADEHEPSGGPPGGGDDASRPGETPLH